MTRTAGRVLASGAMLGTADLVRVAGQGWRAARRTGARRSSIFHNAVKTGQSAHICPRLILVTGTTFRLPGTRKFNVDNNLRALSPCPRCPRAKNTGPDLQLALLREFGRSRSGPFALAQGPCGAVMQELPQEL